MLTQLHLLLFPIRRMLCSPAPAPCMCRLVQLHPPGWSLVPAELEAAFSSRPKMLVLNTPHNPTGKVRSSAGAREGGGYCSN